MDLSCASFANADSMQERNGFMKNTTTELKWGNAILKPGQRVRTTDDSDYAGLEGIILEIHTGEDKETDNLTPDIHCCFDFPESEAEIQKLEERFSYRVLDIYIHQTNNSFNCFLITGKNFVQIIPEIL